jgi:hypothetical protein
MTPGYKKVWVGDKLHVMTIDAYKQHIATVKAIQKAHDIQMDKCEYSTIDENGDQVPTDRYGNYLDRHCD